MAVAATPRAVTSIGLEDFDTLYKPLEIFETSDLGAEISDKTPGTLASWGKFRAYEKIQIEKEYEREVKAFKKKAKSLKKGEKAEEIKKPPIGDRGEFVFTETGDLGLPNNQSIEQVAQVPASKEAIDIFFQKREQATLPLEQAHAEAKKQLREAYIQYKAGDISIDAYLDANRQVEEAEQAINRRQHLPRTVTQLKPYHDKDKGPSGMEELELSFDWYARYPIRDAVNKLVTNEFPYKVFWTRGTKQEVAAPSAIAAAVSLAADAAVTGVSAAPGAVAPAPVEKTQAQKDAARIAAIRAARAKKAAAGR